MSVTSVSRVLVDNRHYPIDVLRNPEGYPRYNGDKDHCHKHAYKHFFHQTSGNYQVTFFDFGFGSVLTSSETFFTSKGISSSLSTSFSETSSGGLYSIRSRILTELNREPLPKRSVS